MMRIWKWIVAATAWASGIGIALLMLPTVADVTHRKLLGPSLPGALEISEIGVVFIAYLAMAAALHRGAHISTPILTSRLRPAAARAARLVGMVVVWALLALMVWGAAGIAAESYSVGEFRFGLVQVPIWPAKLIVPVGLFLMLVELTIQIVREFAASGKRDVA